MPDNQEVSEGRASRWATALAASVIVCAALAAYSNSFSGPFVFDDVGRIPENLRIRQGPASALVGDSSRPVVELSLALNHALGGFDVRGYHVFNLVVHVLAALTLYGIVRRTLVSARLRSRWGRSATGLACAVGLLWVLHPLQTESVTYIVQRAESMMGLFYLLTLYCVTRGAEAENGRSWYGAAVVACALGMGCKPVMVTAPVVVLLYDRAFLAGSFGESLRRRRLLYGGLAGTWLLLPVLLRNGARDWQTSAGFSYKPVSPLGYALTQPGVVVQYLRLSVWPHPLCLDYGWPMARTWLSIVPPAVFVVVLLAATVWLWRNAPAFGFLGAWFFVILAPTSGLVPVADAMFEHRMYLPLAAVVVLLVLAIHALTGKRSWVVFLAVAVGFGFLTAQRNHDYRSKLAIWSDTVAKRPNNARAHNNLGNTLVALGRAQEAVPHLEQAVRLTPDSGEAHNNLGNALLALGRVPEAMEQLQQALQIMPDSAEAHNNMGRALVELGHMPEAVAHFEQAVRLKPGYVEARNNLAVALLALGRASEAVGHLEQAVRLLPDSAEAHYNLGNALVALGKGTEAMPHFEEAVRLKPDSAEAHYNLGVGCSQAGKTSEAMAQYEQAVRLNPDYVEAQNNLARLLATLPPAEGGDPVRAVSLAQRACELSGNRVATAVDTLAIAYAAAGRFPEAVTAAEKAVALARSAGQTRLAGEIEARLELYRSRRPYRPPANGASSRGL